MLLGNWFVRLYHTSLLRLFTELTFLFDFTGESSTTSSMSQAQSKTTVAGCSLEDLCRGVKNYVCDASCLVGLEGIEVTAAKDELLTQLTNIFEEIELQTDLKR